MKDKNGGSHEPNKRKTYKHPKSAAHRRAPKEITHYKYVPPYLVPAMGNGKSKKLEQKLHDNPYNYYKPEDVKGDWW